MGRLHAAAVVIELRILEFVGLLFTDIHGAGCSQCVMVKMKDMVLIALHLLLMRLHRCYASFLCSSTTSQLLFGGSCHNAHAGTICSPACCPNIVTF